MQAGLDALYLSDPAGPFVKVSAATGEKRWSIDVAEEHGVGVSSLNTSGILVHSSFSSEGDDRAPMLRSIDDETGTVLWTARGRESAAWQDTRPVVIDNNVILMDVYDNAADTDGGSGGMLFAFDVETGRTVWSTDLGSTPAVFSSNLLFVADFEFGQALIARTVDGDVVRVDPDDGTMLWRAAVNAVEVDGTDLDGAGRLAVSIRTRTGQLYSAVGLHCCSHLLGGDVFDVGVE